MAAETIGVVASLVALSGVACRIAQSLYVIADDLRTARSNIQDFATELLIFGNLLKGVNTCLSPIISQRPMLETIRQFEGSKTLEMIYRRSDRTINRIRRFKPEVESLGSGLLIMARLKWLLQKPVIQEIRLTINSLMMSLNLVVSTVRLEEQVRQKADRRTM
jgi:hypothetical protein